MRQLCQAQFLQRVWYELFRALSQSDAKIDQSVSRDMSHAKYVEGAINVRLERPYLCTSYANSTKFCTWPNRSYCFCISKAFALLKIHFWLNDLKRPIHPMKPRSNNLAIFIINSSCIRKLLLCAENSRFFSQMCSRCISFTYILSRTVLCTHHRSVTSQSIRFQATFLHWGAFSACGDRRKK